MHECPECGVLTDGAFSEGGIRWAVCDACMEKDLLKQKIGRREDISEWIEDIDPEERP